MRETEGSAGGEPSDPGASLTGTGIPGLDRALGGGLPPHRMYLVRGGPGAGKTTVGLQFLLAGRDAAEVGLYLGLSETRAEIAQLARSHAWSLADIHLHELSVAEQLEADTRQTLFHPADIDFPEAMARLLATVERVRPSRCVVDSLGELRLLAGDPLRYRREILRFKECVAVNRCTVLLLDERRGPRDFEIEHLAQGVILLEHEATGYGADRRRLRVKKLRGAHFREGYHDYRIGTGGVTVFPRLVAAEHRRAVSPTGLLTTGHASLDRLLGGGIDRGGRLLLVGPSGTGKSGVAAWIASSAVARGEPAAIFLSSESPDAFVRHGARLGLPLAAHVQSGAVRMHGIDPAEMSLGELVEEVRGAVEAGARIVVIDDLAGLVAAAADGRSLVPTLRKLLAYLAQQGAITVLVDTRPASARGHAHVELDRLVDTIMAFDRQEHGGEMCFAVCVLKRRGGTHERVILELRLGPPHGIDLGPPLAGAGSGSACDHLSGRIGIDRTR